MKLKKMKLEKNLIKLIHRKAKQECEVTNFIFASTYVEQLHSFINGDIELSNSEIEEKLDFLIGRMTITLDLSYSELEFLRARKCEKEPFSNVNELSYIQSPKENFPKLGRLNKSGIPLFYAAIINSKGNEGLNVVLSEANAYNLDRLSILRSHQKSNIDLKLRSIGIWNSIQQNKKPIYMSNRDYKYYFLAYKKMSNTFHPKLLLAYVLTDRFLADIMCMVGSERLYRVTSIAAKIMFEPNGNGSSIDGIIYSSVAANGAPVIALKPDAVKSKLEHQFVVQVQVMKHYGYEFYSYVNEQRASIAKTGQLNYQPFPLLSYNVRQKCMKQY